MRRNLFNIAAVCILTFVLFHCRNAAASAQLQRSDATVIVSVAGTGAQRVGQGFCVGDGSLVVTARHVLFGNTRPGRDESSGLIALISPYLGEACEARLLAEDAELDLAILESPWTDHPALEFADEQAVMVAAALETESRIALASALVEQDVGAAVTELAAVEVAQLPVDFVGVRGGQARLVCLRRAANLRVGWSGSPVFLPGTSRVAGCLSTISGRHPIVGTDPERATAFLVGPVRLLIEQKGRAASLQRGKVAERPADAERMLALLIEQRILSAQDKPREALERVEAVLKAREKSALYLCWAAAACSDADRVPDANAYYQEALTVDPRSVLARVMYAQFLAEHRQGDRAVELLEDVLRTDPEQTVVAVALGDMLSRQGNHERVVEVASEAVKRAPRDARLWALAGQAQRKLGAHAEAAASLRRAVDLNGATPFRILLAMALEDVKELDEAEAQYRAIVQQDASDARAHFMLANFLANHRPDSLDEAIRELEVALTLPEPKDGPAREHLRSFLGKLQKRRASMHPARQ